MCYLSLVNQKIGKKIPIDLEATAIDDKFFIHNTGPYLQQHQYPERKAVTHIVWYYFLSVSVCLSVFTYCLFLLPYGE